MSRVSALIGTILSLLTGCISKPAPAPQQPGVSHRLAYPVLLIGERDMRLKPDEARLISTTVASGGVYHAGYILIDSEGMEYVVKQATPFGMKSPWLDMGTSSFKVFLDLKPKSRLTLEQAKTKTLEAIRKEAVIVGVDPKNAGPAIKAATSFPELFEVSRRYWHSE
jgi:hypothetical protein